MMNVLIASFSEVGQGRAQEVSERDLIITMPQELRGYRQHLPHYLCTRLGILLSAYVGQSPYVIGMLVEIKLRQAQDAIVGKDIVSEFWAVSPGTLLRAHTACSHRSGAGRQEFSQGLDVTTALVCSERPCCIKLQVEKKCLLQEQYQIGNEPCLNKQATPASTWSHIFHFRPARPV